MIYNYNDAIKMLKEMRIRIEREVEKYKYNTKTTDTMRGVNMMAQKALSLIDDNIEKIHKELRMMKKIQ